MTTREVTALGETVLPGLDNRFELEPDANHQLVILGNGFDIACGLRSRFFDFFGSRMQDVEASGFLEGDYQQTSVSSDNLTAWDLILYARKHAHDDLVRMNWCDVERVIDEVVGMHPDDHGEERKRSSVTIVHLDTRVTIARLREFFSGDVLARPNRITSQVGALLKNRYPHNEPWGMDDIGDALFLELTKLEEEFKGHLTGVLGKTSDYQDKSSKLLDVILREDDDALWTQKACIDILDFNYTQPTIPGRFRSYRPQITNVHGSLDDEIIFGADGTDCMGNPQAARFSKTYRVMSRKRGGLSRRIVFPSESRLIGADKTVAIKFYGHSLSRADYAYFQSIFDVVDLYGGSARLYFFFMPFASWARKELMNNIVSLLDAYGKTMDNKDHGKNLLHKLLLEGRLIIKELPNDLFE